MPIQYKIDKQERIIYTTGHGKLTDVDLIEFKLALQNDQNYISGMKELSDFRMVDQFEVTPNGIKQLVSIDKSSVNKEKNHKLAMVVPHELAYGMARMYQMMTEENNPNIGIFRKVDEARCWLHLP